MMMKKRVKLERSEKNKCINYENIEFYFTNYFHNADYNPDKGINSSKSRFECDLIEFLILLSYIFTDYF